MSCDPESTITAAEIANAKSNFETIKVVTESGSDTTTTPDGKTVDTLTGALKKLGWETPAVAYAGSINFSANDTRKVIERSSILYAPLPSELPFTTTGTWVGDDEDKFFVISYTEAAHVAYDGGTVESFLDALGIYIITSTGIFTADVSGRTLVKTSGYAAAGDGGAATWVATGNTVAGSSGTLNSSTAMIYDSVGTEFALQYDVLNVNQLGMFADTVIDGALVTDHTSQWLQIVDTLRPAHIYMPKRNGYSYRMQIFKVKAESEVFGDNHNLDRGTVVELFYTGSYSVVMGQINSNAYVHDIRVKSMETNLNLQRASIANASNVKLERAVFTGFRDTVAPVDAWGMYLDGSTNVNLEQCGFNENDQSDIAIVDNNKNITIDGCYTEGSSFHINFEPNSSSNINENITLKNMEIDILHMLENGSGGTASRNVHISGCKIATLRYDGAQVTFQDCNFDVFEVESSPFFGEVKFINSIALGPNLLEDPHLFNIGFNSTQAATDNNAWYMNLRTGSIGGDQLDPLEEEGVKFTRINPNGLSGAINFAQLNPVAVTTGEYYLIAVTGRQVSGSSAAYMSVFNGATEYSCRAFRQSNEGNRHWTTEMLIVPASTGNLVVKPGIWTTSTDVFDIHAITLHKVIGGNGGGEGAILNQYHGNIYGPRNLRPVATLPTFADANLQAVQAGDRISLTGTGAPYYWNGTAWTAL